MYRSKTLTLALLAAVSLQGALAAHDGDPKLLDKQPAYPGKGWRNSQRLLGAQQAPLPGGQPVVAQSAQSSSQSQFARSNVTLLSWISLPEFGLGSGANGNSCFGYTSPSGREYALMGHSAGMAIVEITQPGNPVIITTIPGNTSLWRDVRTFGHYAYVVTENNGGIQVVDLANIDNGTAPLVNTVTTGGSGNTHTLEINTTSGFLYRAGGAGNGLRIYDLNANPVNPPFVGMWADRYVHEAQVVSYPGREIAICCGGLNGGFTDTGIDIVDVTNKSNPVSLQHVVYGSPGYSHQAWLTPDGQFLYQNDETDGRPYTRVFDASGLGNPTPTLTYLGEFQNGTSVDHNLYTKGNLIYEANYRSGLRVFDRSASSVSPTLVAWFDTYPEDNSNGYNGLWNNYPYFPSGVVIGSDLERGLFVWWIGTPQIAISYPDGLPTMIDPAGDTLRVRLTEGVAGQLTAGTAKLWVNTGAAWTSSNLVPLSGNDYAAVFPSAPCGTSVKFYIAAQSTNGIVWTAPELAPEQYECVTSGFASTAFGSYDFETGAGWQGAIAGDTATAGAWSRVNPIGTIAQPEDDHSPEPGTVCWVTQNGFSGGAADAADVDGGYTTLRSPVWNMSLPDTWVISYWRWYSNDKGPAPSSDVFRVDVSNDGGSSWLNVETVGPGGPEASGGWYQHEFTVNDFFTPSANVRVRFVAEDLGADSLVEAAVDDLTITRITCTGIRSFCFGDGTASPCPCGNVGAAGAGCANSQSLSGRLTGGGTPTVGADTLILTASQLSVGTTLLFFQGTSAANGGLGIPFGDGLLCASGSFLRLGVTLANGSGVASYPGAGDPSVSVMGLVPAGASRTYQAWYRDAVVYCTSATNNLTNGVSVSWR
ncbi:MAG: choice-of-anchor B family protein [Planctomycetes bacterium]|nr:choice-of-anchor B family protein [Planctomycetota bacterium]